MGKGCTQNHDGDKVIQIGNQDIVVNSTQYPSPKGRCGRILLLFEKGLFVCFAPAAIRAGEQTRGNVLIHGWLLGSCWAGMAKSSVEITGAVGLCRAAGAEDVFLPGLADRGKRTAVKDFFQGMSCRTADRAAAQFFGNGWLAVGFLLGWHGGCFCFDSYQLFNTDYFLLLCILIFY